jgi:hypothetical protein
MQTKLLTVIVVVFLYAVLNIFIFVLSDPGCYAFDGFCAIQENSSDSIKWANSFIKFSGFIAQEKPLNFGTNFPPGHAIIIVTTRLFGASNLVPMVWLQLIALFIVGWIVKVLVEREAPEFGTLALILVVSNPNALASAHLPYAGIFSLLMITLSLHCLIQFCKRGSYVMAALAGGFLGAAVLFRPVAQYLIPLLPIIILVAVWLTKRSWKRCGIPSVCAAAIATCAAILVVFPWLLHQHNSGVGWRFAGNDRELLFITDNLRYLTPSMPGEANRLWKKQFPTEQMQRLATQESEWENLSVSERRKLRLKDARTYLLSMPFDGRVFAIAWLKSTLRFFTLGGSGAMHSLFGLEYKSRTNPVAYWGLKTWGITYALTLRMLGLFGIVWLIIRGHRATLFILVGLVLYYWLAHFVHGKPRFRLAVEAPLAMLAVYGIVWLQYLYKKSFRK